LQYANVLEDLQNTGQELHERVQKLLDAPLGMTSPASPSTTPRRHFVTRAERDALREEAEEKKWRNRSERMDQVAGIASPLSLQSASSCNTPEGVTSDRKARKRLRSEMQEGRRQARMDLVAGLASPLSPQSASVSSKPTTPMLQPQPTTPVGSSACPGQSLTPQQARQLKRMNAMNRIAGLPELSTLPI
jgi:hypothetical protein